MVGPMSEFGVWINAVDSALIEAGIEVDGETLLHIASDISKSMRIAQEFEPPVGAYSPPPSKNDEMEECHYREGIYKRWIASKMNLRADEVGILNGSVVRR